jgi:hypothetical protein
MQRYAGVRTLGGNAAGMRFLFNAGKATGIEVN